MVSESSDWVQCTGLALESSQIWSWMLKLITVRGSSDVRVFWGQYSTDEKENKKQYWDVMPSLMMDTCSPNYFHVPPTDLFDWQNEFFVYTVVYRTPKTHFLSNTQFCKLFGFEIIKQKGFLCCVMNGWADFRYILCRRSLSAASVLCYL
jgi:hypothetical protein